MHMRGITVLCVCVCLSVQAFALLSIHGSHFDETIKLAMCPDDPLAMKTDCTEYMQCDIVQRHCCTMVLGNFAILCGHQTKCMHTPKLKFYAAPLNFQFVHMCRPQLAITLIFCKIDKNCCMMLFAVLKFLVIDTYYGVKKAKRLAH